MNINLAYALIMLLSTIACVAQQQIPTPPTFEDKKSVLPQPGTLKKSLLSMLPTEEEVEEPSFEAAPDVPMLEETVEEEVTAEETEKTLKKEDLPQLEPTQGLPEEFPEQLPVPEEQMTVVEEKVVKETSIPIKKESYLEKFLHPWEYGDQDELLEFEFENAELINFVNYIEKHFGLTFIYDDQINPSPNGGKKITGTKITFRTHQPITKKEAWELFVAFLDIAGLSPQPGPRERVYKLTTNDPKSPLSVLRGPVPSFIGVDISEIPDNDMRIRYVYFVENTSLDVIKNIIDSMKSTLSPNVIVFPELRAIIMTDKATNIRAMLTVIKELDKVTMPETLSIIKLKNTDATKIAQLYKTLVQDESQPTGLAARLLGGRKQPTTSYFSENTRVIPEPRTNSLILLGTRDAVKRIEDFIAKEIDKELDIPFSPLHIYQLKYVEAEAIASILKDAVQFQVESDAAKYGGVRGGDKYFKPISITPEKSGNRLIINADYDDYVKIYETLQKLDVEQPQVAIKVLILNVDFSNTKEVGVQMRNKKPGPNGLIGNNINYQNSGIAGTSSTVVENTSGTGATRLLGDLVNLAKTATTPGSTFVTLGSDVFGVWGMLKVLESYSNISVIANPFLVATHKYPASVSLGEIRRILTGTSLTSTGPVNSFDDLPAKLEVYIEPQISYEGFITLNVRVRLERFDESDQSSGNRTEKEVKTSVIMANNQVLAIGGLTTDRVEDGVNKWPILGDIPVVGWLFKNKTKIVVKSSLLILITPEIIPAKNDEVARRFTQSKINDARAITNETYSPMELRDPIHRWFFRDADHTEARVLDEYIFKENRYVDPSLRAERDSKAPKQRGATGMITNKLTDFVPDAKPEAAP